MDDDKEQKQHAATGKRLAELSEKGQTLRSKDLSGGMLLFATVIIMMLIGPYFCNVIVKNYFRAFTHINEVANNEGVVIKLFDQMVFDTVYVVLPFLILIVVVPFLPVFLLGGWNFSLKAVRFKWETLDLFKNIGTLFSARIFVDIAKSTLKFAVIAILFTYFMFNNTDALFLLTIGDPHHAFGAMYDLIERFTIYLLLGAMIIASVDALYSYYDYHNRIKMTLQEIKDEAKEADGSPEVKRKMRSMMMSILRQKVKQMVPEANVIITNPTHYAIALRYREGVDRAPKVIAKGKGVMAKYIRGLATNHSIPIYEAPTLARAIYHTTKLNAEVQPALYVAVALVLSYINQLRFYQMGQGPMPLKADNLEIPPEYIFNR